MQKFLLFVLVHFAVTASVQLLNVYNLQHLSFTEEQILHTKLSAHFDLLHQAGTSEDKVKVYSNEHSENAGFMVVTVFIRDKGCHVFSIVSHDQKQVKSFLDMLHEEKFKAETIKNSDNEEISVFEKNNIKVLIKNPNHVLPAHQIVWMCK